ncbi:MULTISPECIES: hypothetical protein [Pseudomonas]|jgi:cob(I)alamin adenosyltransferase|uniref:Uncharacterized protein n=1 Tax=Pseudomonas sp. 13.2 TaxID=3144665 RepID=A0AAU7BIC7_9PSED|nr:MULTISPECIES: hypothetical protein [Pseudomonas]MDF3928133.1 hypothetical protein [Pseudomonas putida]
MTTKLPEQDLFELAKAFHSLSNEIGNYRFSNWNSLTSAQRNDLEAMEWTLFNTSSDLNAKSALLKIQMLDEELQTIKTCTQEMQTVTQNIQSIKKAIAVATKAIAFGGAIYLAASTGNITILIPPAKSLISEIQS